LEQETLRRLIRAKLADGRLPQDGIPHLWGGAGNGETYDREARAFSFMSGACTSGTPSGTCPAEVIRPGASGGAASASSSPRTVTSEARKVEPRTGQGTIDALHRGGWFPSPDGIGQKASGAASITNSSVFVLR